MTFLGGMWGPSFSSPMQRRAQPSAPMKSLTGWDTRDMQSPCLGPPEPLTVEPGFGSDAAAEAEAILAVTDVEGGHGRVVGHLWGHTGAS